MIAICKCEPCQRRAVRRRFSEFAHHDPAILWALRTLRAIEPDASAIPNVRQIRVRPTSPDCYALVTVPDRRSRQWIVVDPTSPYYVAAARNEDAVGLAVILHHEFFHVRFGRDEGPAYYASLALAQRAGASPELVSLLEDRVRTFAE